MIAAQRVAAPERAAAVVKARFIYLIIYMGYGAKRWDLQSFTSSAGMWSLTREEETGRR
jgi:hypothetical protein